MLFAIVLCAAPLHAQNLVLNGGFDDSLIGWVSSGDGGINAEWSAADADDNADSGSAFVANFSAGPSNGVTLAQCVPVHSGQTYILSGKVRIPSGAGQILTDKTVLSVRWYSGPDCTTANGGAVTFGPTPASFDIWVSQQATIAARVGSRSVEVRALVSKTAAGGSLSAYFDDITFTSPSIFENGFD
jgi:hypothetical protein